MSKARSKRILWLVAIALVALGFGYSLVKVFQENLVFFYTPSQILSGDTPVGLKSYRIGGMVEQGSVQRASDSLDVVFVVADNEGRVPVEFTGILPDLFKEGTGVVADGVWDGNVFKAHEVLAKHDEEYMPRGVEGYVKPGGSRGYAPYKTEGYSPYKTDGYAPAPPYSSPTPEGSQPAKADL